MCVSMFLALKGMYKACESIAQRSCILLMLCSDFLFARASTYGETHSICRIAGMFVWNGKHYCEVMKDIRHIRVCAMHRLKGYQKK